MFLRGINYFLLKWKESALADSSCFTQEVVEEMKAQIGRISQTYGSDTSDLVSGKSGVKTVNK